MAYPLFDIEAFQYDQTNLGLKKVFDMTGSWDLIIEIGVGYETFIFCNAARC